MSYVPGWQFSFPEPMQWNGDDDRDERRSTGPRRELAACYECGNDIVHEPVVLDSGKQFCRLACRERWVRR